MLLSSYMLQPSQLVTLAGRRMQVTSDKASGAVAVGPAGMIKRRSMMAGSEIITKQVAQLFEAPVPSHSWSSALRVSGNIQYHFDVFWWCCLCTEIFTGHHPNSTPLEARLGDCLKL